MYDVGGNAKIRTIWSDYYAAVHAAVFVVDAANPARFAEAQKLFCEASSHASLRGKPILVVANKQDAPQAAGASELAEALRVHEADEDGSGRCQITSGSLSGARPIGDASDLDHGLSWLIGKVQANYPTLSTLVATQVAEKEEADRKRREERKARVAAKKAAREAEAAAKEAEAAAAAAQEAAGATGEVPGAPAAPQGTGIDVGLPGSSLASS